MLANQLSLLGGIMRTRQISLFTAETENHTFYKEIVHLSRKRSIIARYDVAI